MIPLAKAGLSCTLQVVMPLSVCQLHVSPWLSMRSTPHPLLLPYSCINCRHPATWVLDNPQPLQHMAVSNNVVQEQLIPSAQVATGKIDVPDHTLQVCTTCYY